ncbi:MAG: hypothetical protein KDK78_11355 [Chlamydiia bacterium]|nr:hypothetical protein [Chlamydiia bacterium]
MLSRLICSVLLVLLAVSCQRCYDDGYVAGPLRSQGEVVSIDSLAEDPSPFPQIKIQSSGLARHLSIMTRKVFERWLAETGYSIERNGAPRLILTGITDVTGLGFDKRQVEKWFTDIAAADGRFCAVVATTGSEAAQAYLQSYLLNDPYYSNSSVMVEEGKALQCFASIELSTLAATNGQTASVVVDLTLNDIENSDISISDWDVLDDRSPAMCPR